MQSSMWKLLTAVGIIGIGTLVVLEVQSRLPKPSQASSAAVSANALAEIPAETDVVPDATTDLDKMLAGAEEFDDSRFVLNEPDVTSDVSVPVDATGERVSVPVTSVNRTVLKDNLTDNNNPFERSFESDNTSDSANPTTVVSPQSKPIVAIQPARFDGDSVPAVAKSDAIATKQTNSSGTIFFNGNSSQKVTKAANSTSANLASPESMPSTSRVAIEETNSIAASGQAFSDIQAASAGTAVPTAQINSGAPDLFMPDAPSDSTRPANPATPRNVPADDAPLMDLPGFEPDFAPKPPDNPRIPNTNPVPADVGAGNSGLSPTIDDNTRFFEPDEPVPAPPAGDGGSRPNTRPELPPAFELDPVPELDVPRESPRSTPDLSPRPSPNSPPEDDFPTPSYPERSPRPDLDGNPPFGTSPSRGNTSDDSRNLPAINDRPRGSFPDSSRGNTGEQSNNSDDRSMSQVMRPQLSIQKQAPDRATVGVSHEYTILVSNEGDSSAYDIVVDDDLGDSARLEYSKPPAEFDRNTGKLNWRITELAPREKQEILVRITPTGEGTLDGIATVRFKAQVKSATVITAPKIILEVTGPAEVKVGDEVQLRYIVRNNGTGDASNVILRSVLPPGLKHSEGGDLEYEIDNLRAGDEEKIDLTVVAVEPGSRLRTKSEVTMSGASADQVINEIDIVGSQLTIQRLGPDRRFVGRTATFQNIIANDTNFEASNAIVTEQVPEGMRFVSADNGGVYNPQTGQIRWEIDRLLPHKQTVLEVELEAEAAGQRQTIVEVLESAGFRSQALENTIVTVEDYENMTADISRQDAPVAVGETFGFTITIENRGTAVARSVEMVVNVPSEITVKAAGTRTNPARRVGNSVHYALVESIQPGEKMMFELKLQGERPAQNALVRASLKYEHLKEPLIVTESVTIFEDRP